MPTALGSACRQTHASVLSSYIEGVITSPSVLVQSPLLYAAPHGCEPLCATLLDLSSPQQGRPCLAGVAYCKTEKLDASTGAVLQTLEGHSDAAAEVGLMASAVAFSPDAGC